MKKISNHRLVVLLIVLLLVVTIANIIFVKALQYEIGENVQTIYKVKTVAPKEKTEAVDSGVEVDIELEGVTTVE